MSRRDIVVIGASAGGVEALRALVAELPADLPAAVLVVLHVPARAPSALPVILSRSGALTAVHAVHGERLQYGRIYVAPPDHHLLIEGDRVALSHGPTENGHRPAVDVLFRSAARSYRERVAGVVLSGGRDDGTAGLSAISERGGLAIVQDPEEALHSSMPRSAAEYVAVDHVLSATGIGQLICKIAGDRGSAAQQLAAPPDRQDELDEEIDMAESAPSEPSYLSKPAGFGCPTCHGALFELSGTPVPRYRCRIGHAWSPESLLDEQSAALEGALWMGLRSLEEKASLATRMAESATRRNHGFSAARYSATARDAWAAAQLIRDLVLKLDSRADVPGEMPGAGA
jgi:two-component system chemotaxis response regulator CheB